MKIKRLYSAGVCISKKKKNDWVPENFKKMETTLCSWCSIRNIRVFRK